MTGGLGTVGSAVVRRLVAAGAHVTVCDAMLAGSGAHLLNIEAVRQDVELVVGDIADPELAGRLTANRDFIFSLAARTGHIDSMSAPDSDLHANVLAPLRLLEACRRGYGKVVFASTRQVYGRPLRLPVDESHPVQPVDVNGIHKAAAEQYHALYWRVHGVRSCTLRLTNVYGPGMRIRDARQSFVGAWVRAACERSSIEVFGDGTQRRDLLYVDDCADALLVAALCDASDGRTYNVGGSDVLSLNEIAALLCELAPPAHVWHVPFPAERERIDIGDYFTDDRRIRAELGWRPETPLREGLQRTVEFYRQHLGRYVDEAA